MILLIDTSKIEEIYLALGKDQSVSYEKSIPAKFEQQEKLTPSLIDFLKKNNYSLEDVSGIIVVSGPGSFSALRIGLAVANTLAWSLHIPIIGFTKDQFGDYHDLFKQGSEALQYMKEFRLVEPQYGKEPNINLSTK